MSPLNEHTDMDSRRFVLRIFRYNAESDRFPRFDKYEINAVPGTTVLGALFIVQQQQDPSLVFRFSCRGAVCGSCGMTINGRCGLACRTQLYSLPTNEVILEPLPNLDVIRDLVVDMSPFWEKYRRIRPWLHNQIEQLKRNSGDNYSYPRSTERECSGSFVCENRQRPHQFQRIEQYTNCILCACCYGACPVLKRQPGYMGPAALAKLLRFVDDSRDHRRTGQLEEVDNADGVWGCDTVYRCIDTCPKDVRPTDGIAALRRRLITYRIRNGLRRNHRQHPDKKHQAQEV